MTDYSDPLDEKWVKHPSKDPHPSDRLVVDWKEIEFDLTEGSDPSIGKLAWVLKASNARDEFEKTGEAFHAIEAFNWCHMAGVYPPLSVLNWLNFALLEYYKSDGTENLIELLGLKNGRGKNQIKSMKKEKYESDYFAQEINHLVSEFNISIDNAAEMVCAREEQNGRQIQSDAWLAEQYKRHWKKKLVKNKNEWIPQEGNEKARKAYLDTFPKELVAKHVK
jgi:hypothetical protein